MLLGQTLGGLHRGYPGILDDFIEQIERQENNQPKKHVPPTKTAPLPPGHVFMVFISGRDPSFFTGQSPIKLMYITNRP